MLSGRRQPLPVKGREDSSSASACNSSTRDPLISENNKRSLTDEGNCNRENGQESWDDDVDRENLGDFINHFPSVGRANQYHNNSKGQRSLRDLLSDPKKTLIPQSKFCPQERLSHPVQIGKRVEVSEGSSSTERLADDCEESGGRGNGLVLEDQSYRSGKKGDDCRDVVIDGFDDDCEGSETANNMNQTKHDSCYGDGIEPISQHKQGPEQCVGAGKPQTPKESKASCNSDGSQICTLRQQATEPAMLYLKTASNISSSSGSLEWSGGATRCGMTTISSGPNMALWGGSSGTSTSRSDNPPLSPNQPRNDQGAPRQQLVSDHPQNEPYTSQQQSVPRPENMGSEGDLGIRSNHEQHEQPQFPSDFSNTSNFLIRVDSLISSVTGTMFGSHRDESTFDGTSNNGSGRNPSSRKNPGIRHNLSSWGSPRKEDQISSSGRRSNADLLKERIDGQRNIMQDKRQGNSQLRRYESCSVAGASRAATYATSHGKSTCTVKTEFDKDNSSSSDKTKNTPRLQLVRSLSFGVPSAQRSCSFADEASVEMSLEGSQFVRSNGSSRGVVSKGIKESDNSAREKEDLEMDNSLSKDEEVPLDTAEAHRESNDEPQRVVRNDTNYLNIIDSGEILSHWLSPAPSQNSQAKHQPEDVGNNLGHPSPDADENRWKDDEDWKGHDTRQCYETCEGYDQHGRFGKQLQPEKESESFCQGSRASDTRHRLPPGIYSVRVRDFVDLFDEWSSASPAKDQNWRKLADETDRRPFHAREDRSHFTRSEDVSQDERSFGDRWKEESRDHNDGSGSVVTERIESISTSRYEESTLAPDSITLPSLKERKDQANKSTPRSAHREPVCSGHVISWNEEQLNTGGEASESCAPSDRWHISSPSSASASRDKQFERDHDSSNGRTKRNDRNRISGVTFSNGRHSGIKCTASEDEEMKGQNKLVKVREGNSTFAETSESEKSPSAVETQARIAVSSESTGRTGSSLFGGRVGQITLGSIGSRTGTVIESVGNHKQVEGSQNRATGRKQFCQSVVTRLWCGKQRRKEQQRQLEQQRVNLNVQVAFEMQDQVVPTDTSETRETCSEGHGECMVTGR